MKSLWEPPSENPQKAQKPHSAGGRPAVVQEYGRQFSPATYATPKTIRPYSLGQNAEWDAVSRMLAAGLVTVAPDPMAVGFVRVSAVSTPHTAHTAHTQTAVLARPRKGTRS